MHWEKKIEIVNWKPKNNCQCWGKLSRKTCALPATSLTNKLGGKCVCFLSGGMENARPAAIGSIVELPAHTLTHTHTQYATFCGTMPDVYNKINTLHSKKKIDIYLDCNLLQFSPPDLFSCCCCAALCTDQSHMENLLYKRVNAHIDPIQIRRDRLDRDFHNCAQSISL